jgi:hypothetical protein
MKEEGEGGGTSSACVDTSWTSSTSLAEDVKEMISFAPMYVAEVMVWTSVVPGSVSHSTYVRPT